MWILGFDSTASTVSAAILKDSAPVAVYSAESATSHSTTLLPAIEKLLSAAGISVSELDLISCSAGPGSFTGVRIGVSTAKGLAAPADVPCIGVSSLEAMAYSFCELKGLVCPALGARRGNVYAALFYSDGNGGVTRMTDDDLVSVKSLREYIDDVIPADKLGYPLYLAGDSIVEASEVCASCENVALKATPALLASPTGFGAALCGLNKYKESGYDRTAFSESLLMPIYLRKSQAERERDEKLISF